MRTLDSIDGLPVPILADYAPLRTIILPNGTNTLALSNSMNDDLPIIWPYGCLLHLAARPGRAILDTHYALIIRIPRPIARGQLVILWRPEWLLEL